MPVTVLPEEALLLLLLFLNSGTIVIEMFSVGAGVFG